MLLFFYGQVIFCTRTLYVVCSFFRFVSMKAKHLFMFAMLFLLICTIKGTWQLYDSKQMRVKGEKALALEKKKVKLTEDQEEDKGKWMGYQERNQKLKI